MTDPTKSTFAKRIRAAKPCAKKYEVWDDVISGLALRVGTSGHRSFFLRRSVRGRLRSATIGNADDMTLPEARAEARKLIAAFIDTVKKNGGPEHPAIRWTPSPPSSSTATPGTENPGHWNPAPTSFATTSSPPSAI